MFCPDPIAFQQLGFRSALKKFGYGSKIPRAIELFFDIYSKKSECIQQFRYGYGFCQIRIRSRFFWRVELRNRFFFIGVRFGTSFLESQIPDPNSVFLSGRIRIRTLSTRSTTLCPVGFAVNPGKNNPVPTGIQARFSVSLSIPVIVICLCKE